MKVLCKRCRSYGYLVYDYKRCLFYIVHPGKCRHAADPDEYEPILSDRLNLIKYAGGDTTIIKPLLKLMPDHICYVEVFGGGAVFLLNKPPSKVEVYNDVDGDLVNLFKVVKERPDEFLKELDLLPYSRQLYYEFQYKLRGEEDPIKRAAMYYYIIRCCFSGKVGSGFSTGKGVNQARKYFNALEDIRKIHKRLKNVVIEQLDFRDCILRYDGERTLFYLDPPHLYYATEKGKDYYKYGFTDRDYMDLLNLLTKIKGKFILKQTYQQFVAEWARENKFNMKVITAPRWAKRDFGERKYMGVMLIYNFERKRRGRGFAREAHS